MGGDCLARVSVSLFVDRESEERVQRSRVGGDCLARVPVSLFVDRESEESLEEPSGRRLSRSVSLFVDRESEESPEEPSGRRVSQESQSLCLLTEKVRRV